MAFNPDEYLAKKDVPFDPDAYITQKTTEPPSVIGSGLRGLTSGVTLGYDDELQGAMGAAGRAAGIKNLGSFHPLDPNSHLEYDSPTLSPDELMNAYRSNRDASRAQQALDIKTNPKASFAGNLAGGLMNPLKMAPLVGGAITGLGNSEADLTHGDVLGAAKDTGTGAVLGKTIDAGLGLAGKGIGAIANSEPIQNISKKVSDWLKDKAELQILRAVGAQKGSFNKLNNLGDTRPNEAGRYILDHDIAPIFSNTSDMAEKNLAQRAKDAANRDQLYSKVDALGASEFNPHEAASEMEKSLGGFRQDSDLSAQVAKKNQLADTLQAVKLRGPNKIPLKEAQDLIEELAEEANWSGVGNRSAKEEFARQAAMAGRKQLNESIGRTGEKLGEPLLQPAVEKTNRNMMSSYDVEKFIKNKLAQENGNRSFGLTDAIIAAPALAAGLISPHTTMSTIPATIAAIGAKKLGEKYGHKVAAHSAEGLGNLIAQAPEAFGKYSKVLQDAASRGPSALAATQAILSQKPDFQALMKKLTGTE